MIDVPTFVRNLYREFYGGDRRTKPDVSLSSVSLDDIRYLADESEAEQVMNYLTSKKWSVVDAARREFKIHDTPHNYNVQILAHGGKDALNDRKVKTSKNSGKLAKYLLSGTGAIVLPVFNMETAKLPTSVSTKMKNLGVAPPRGSRYSLEFTERFFRTKSLAEHMRGGMTSGETKQLLYQAVDSLRKCREALPGFVHNGIAPNTLKVLQRNPGAMHGGSRGLAKSEIRLTGFEKSSIDNKASVTKDLKALADVFRNAGSTPVGTESFLERMGNAKSYAEVLSDSYFADIKEPIVVFGGGKKKTKVMKKRASSSSSSSSSLSSSSSSNHRRGRANHQRHASAPRQAPAAAANGPFQNRFYNLLGAADMFNNPNAAIMQPQMQQQNFHDQFGQAPSIVPAQMATAALFGSQPQFDGQQQFGMPPAMQQQQHLAMPPMQPQQSFGIDRKSVV